ncbi:MAG TPA: hypothetical protein DEG28_01080 [Porphyromonadaceae bacterium]|nr:hypothetical protein [Porphyromonadaceae bacterium]
MTETIVTAVVGILTSVGGYFVGRRKRQNDFLSELQGSIDMLSAKNAKLLEDIVELRMQNAELLASVASLKLQNESLKKEISELNARLEELKTMTTK